MFFRWDAAVCFQQAFHVDATNLSRDNIYSGGVSLEPTSIHPPIHLNTCCFDIVGSEQQTTWEKKKHRESHSRLSRSSADDLDDIRPRGDIWEVWLPLLQLLRQPVRGNQEKNSPNMRFCTKCPHHTSLILIQLEGVIHHDSLYILTCEAALWLIVTPTLWKAATSTIRTWLCLCVLQLTGSYYSSCFFLTRTWATCTQIAKTVQQWFQFISVCNKNQLTETWGHQTGRHHNELLIFFSETWTNCVQQFLWPPKQIF